MGNPYNLTAEKEPDYSTLANNTFVTYGDLDASPTKAWLIEHRNEAEWRWHYDYAFGKRPREELFILKDDPDQLKNVASEAKYAAIKKKLNAQLLAELKRTGDPRVMGDGSTFDNPPFVAEFKRPLKKNKAQKK